MTLHRIDKIYRQLFRLLPSDLKMSLKKIRLTLIPRRTKLSGLSLTNLLIAREIIPLLIALIASKKLLVVMTKLYLMLMKIPVIALVKLSLYFPKI